MNEQEFKKYLFDAIQMDNINSAIELIKKHKYYNVSLDISIKENYIMLVKYLIINKYCSIDEAVIISLENSQMEIFNYLKKFVINLKPLLGAAILNNSADSIIQIMDKIKDPYNFFS
uniref:Ankyrin repeat-containing protein n=1 Tax=Borely moumouvirus TaxID=2712067 RepID=A0A6G6ADK3_9VIRU